MHIFSQPYTNPPTMSTKTTNVVTVVTKKKRNRRRKKDKELVVQVMTNKRKPRRAKQQVPTGFSVKRSLASDKMRAAFLWVRSLLNAKGGAYRIPDDSTWASAVVTEVKRVNFTTIVDSVSSEYIAAIQVSPNRYEAYRVATASAAGVFTWGAWQPMNAKSLSSVAAFLRTTACQVEIVNTVAELSLSGITYSNTMTPTAGNMDSLPEVTESRLTKMEPGALREYELTWIPGDLEGVIWGPAVTNPTFANWRVPATANSNVKDNTLLFVWVGQGATPFVAEIVINTEFAPDADDSNFYDVQQTVSAPEECADALDGIREASSGTNLANSLAATMRAGMHLLRPVAEAGARVVMGRFGKWAMERWGMPSLPASNTQPLLTYPRSSPKIEEIEGPLRGMEVPVAQLTDALGVPFLSPLHTKGVFDDCKSMHDAYKLIARFVEIGSTHVFPDGALRAGKPLFVTAEELNRAQLLSLDFRVEA